MKGILFKPEMIKAIVEGRKTETRRLQGLNVLNRTIDFAEEPSSPDDYSLMGFDGKVADFCRQVATVSPFNVGMIYKVASRYHTGEVVYIKEAFCYKADPITARISDNEFWYRSTNPEIVKIDGDGGIELTKAGYEASPWISPLFMPERAARYFIEILEVRPERLQDITEEGALREGMKYYADSLAFTARGAYSDLWDSINKKNQWASNPWVWVISFELAPSTEGR